ncbi:hypothetical protein LEP1GSC036_3922 [Leptospira weilii str. 2006001853]|uniref:Uncharacterized protein n=1 Tax=Leptospira weilii str. 2006001853 TaxID=1001589 RepID=A0A828Z7G8_9LEPT|nr:hypothetical protein [Leptospira weilii]EKR66388.1 hypothetical protein LEP1GSC036_3922 [Leptospira weilii str. 2006001853]EMN43011.1 hypothetical protein LEP1GSC086_0019 [Leptospira weilii str. LNT 1234]QDK23876.1 hypothetical protein FHG67_14995 [Leptospira weilii]QDK26487.1 hypothetical protein FHG68_07265 [Leptospira weilii]ULH28728.1 hypothetical protein FH586_01890 [Leptospira weilii]
MLNKVADLKKQLRIQAESLDLSDERDGDSPSAYEDYLESAAMLARVRMFYWEVTIPDEGPFRPALLTAEVLLIKAEIIEEFGFNDGFDPEEVSTGGGEGTRVKHSRMSAEERGEIAEGFRNKAYFLLFGKQPSESPGVV